VTSRDSARAAVAAVLTNGDPVKLDDLAPAEAAYARRRGELAGLTTDAEIEAAYAENVPADDAELDEIVARRRGGVR